MPYKDPAKAKAHRAAYYAANADREREIARGHAQRLRAIWRAEARQIVGEANGTTCSDCGETFDPLLLHFHHRPGTEKRFNIGNVSRLRGVVTHEDHRPQ